jgi:hypothetical protein
VKEIDDPFVHPRQESTCELNKDGSVNWQNITPCDEIEYIDEVENSHNDNLSLDNSGDPRKKESVSNVSGQSRESINRNESWPKLSSRQEANTASQIQASTSSSSSPSRQQPSTSR